MKSRLTRLVGGLLGVAAVVVGSALRADESGDPGAVRFDSGPLEALHRFVPGASGLLHDVSFHIERDDAVWGVDQDDAYWSEFSLGTGIEALWHPSDWAWLSSRVTRYQSALGYDRYTDSELGLEYARTLGRGFESYLWVAGGHRRYDAAYDKRIGAQEDWRLGVSSALSFSPEAIPGLSLELRYDYERSRSNDPLMRYDDQLIGVYWTWERVLPEPVGDF